MKTLTQIADQVRSLILDYDQYLRTPGDIDAAVERAVAALSQWKPRVKIADIAGDGSTFRITLPTGWQAGFSQILEAVYPFDAASRTQPDLLVPDEDYTIEQQPDDSGKLVTRSFVPESGQTLRLRFTLEHAVTTSTSTLQSTADENAVIYFAAAECLRMMATAANASEDPEILASAVNRFGKGTQYLSLAKVYEERSGLSQKSAPALVMGESFSRPDDQNSLTHRRA